MQININIQLDPGELAELVRSFASLMAATPVAPMAIVEAPPTPPSALLRPDTPAGNGTPVLAAIAPATEAADVAEAALEAPVVVRKPKPMPEKRGALLPGQTEKPKRAATTDRLPFDDLDPLVRSEMKRLSLDKRIPSHNLWNAERDSRLPTLGGVMARYGVGTLVDLAAKLDMQPPLSAVATNGVHHKEPAP